MRKKEPWVPAQVPFPSRGYERSERHGEDFAAVPEVLLGKRGARSDVRPPAVRKDLLGMREEPWVPQTEEDPGS